MTLGEYIRALKIQNHLTQASLAEMLHITDKAVSKWERDISYPDISLFPRLADILGVTVSDLLRVCIDEGPASRLTEIFQMSHDIRTPIHIILGYADLLKGTVDDPERIQLVKGRACAPSHAPDGVVHTDSRSLLSGLLYYVDCGTRLYFSHNVTTKKMADGTKRKYERDMYRCYRKLSSRKTCRGPSAYNAERLNDAVDTEIRKHLARLGSISEEDLLKAACSQNADLYEVAYRQAEEEFQKAIPLWSSAVLSAGDAPAARLSMA